MKCECCKQEIAGDADVYCHECHEDAEPKFWSAENPPYVLLKLVFMGFLTLTLSLNAANCDKKEFWVLAGMFAVVAFGEDVFGAVKKVVSKGN